MKKVFNSSFIIFLLLLQYVVPSYVDAEPIDARKTLVGSNRDCLVDSDCMAITSSPNTDCYHIDPEVQLVCPIINRNYDKGKVLECVLSVGCRPVINISCQQGLCIGEAATLPLSIEDTLGKYGFWSKSENPRCQYINRKLIKKFNQCIVGERFTLTGNRVYVCSSDEYGDFHAYNTKTACIEDLKALKAAHLLR